MNEQFEKRITLRVSSCQIMNIIIERMTAARLEQRTSQKETIERQARGIEILKEENSCLKALLQASGYREDEING